MKLYCLALILVIISIGSGQLPECNPANNTTLNSMTASIQPPANNTSVNSAAASSQPPANITNISVKDSNVIDLDLEVFEVESTSARFGVGKKEPAKHEMYKISITNKAESRITDVNVSAMMPEDMKFESTMYYEESRGRLDITRDPIDFKKGTRTNLKWNIGILEPYETKSILLETYMKPNVNNSNVSVYVTGKLNGNEEKSKPKDAEVAICELINKFDGNPCETLSETCLAKCPDWSNPQ
jgi:hypothetical protein